MNSDNLISFDEMDPDKAREIQRKGGIASGKRRRELGNYREALTQLLTSNVPKDSPLMSELGIEKRISYQTATMLGLLKSAIEGNSRAMELILKIIGQYPSDKDSAVIVSPLDEFARALAAYKEEDEDPPEQ